MTTLTNKSFDLQQRQASATRLISGTEPFVLGHYPDYPIFPGVLTVDLARELAEELVTKLYERKARTAKLKRFQFLGTIHPGDVLSITAQTTAWSNGGTGVRVTVSTANEVKARGTLHLVVGQPSSQPTHIPL